MRADLFVPDLDESPNIEKRLNYLTKITVNVRKN